MPQAPFEILEIRARGSYAVLCRARRTDDPLQRDIALKVLKDTLSKNPSMLPRARDEARVLSRISHPNVVRVEELLTLRRRPLVVMEWVPGLSVGEVLKAHRVGLPAPVALEIARRTARALADVYAMPDADGRPLRVLHRDIQPASLMVTGHGQVKVVDFGVSRGDYEDREASTVSTVLGTLAYMAPERCLQGSDEGPAVDVYSLGITLVEMVTGVRPVLPRDLELHARSLPGLLNLVDAEGLTDEQRPLFRALLAAMCDPDPATRATAAEVAERCTELFRSEVLTEALARWADDQVRPTYRARPQVPPRQHPGWRDVAFLEEPEQRATDPTASAERAVRRFLRQDGWADRPKELRQVLAIHPEWKAEPFLALLSQAVRPWWKFWAQPPEAAQLVAALSVLKHRRLPDAAALAEQLRHDGRPEVAAAAQALLEAYEQKDRGA